VAEGKEPCFAGWHFDRRDVDVDAVVVERGAIAAGIGGEGIATDGGGVGLSIVPSRG